MQWPKFLKIKIPKLFSLPQIPKLFQSQLSFYGTWKKFIRQIPTESRSILKSYPHFILMGNAKSGKTELIQGLIEQCQDLYPFETILTENPEMQFYLGPRQVIQEMSFSTLENRSIKARRQIIRLWKKLFATQNPAIIITYDCSSGAPSDLREINKLAGWIAGKITLLSEIGKKPLKIRIALTHLDQIPGYLEFSRFLKQQNISFSVPLTSNFESNFLEQEFKKFSEEHLSLVLTSVSQEDYLKILQFFKEMPELFPAVEEFLRALMTRISFKEAIQIDRLALTSNQESSSAFPLFQWEKKSSIPLFFRYPLLGHQIAAAFLFILSLTFVLNTYNQARTELQLVQKGIEVLDLLQISTFQKKTVAELYKTHSTKNASKLFSKLQTPFFKQKVKLEKNQLAEQIRKYLIEPEYRKTILEKDQKGELKYLYYLGLLRASNQNKLGKFIKKYSPVCANELNFDEKLIKLYVNYCSKPVATSILNESRSSPYLPLTSLEPWSSFLNRFEEIARQPILVEQAYEKIIKDSEKLLLSVRKLREDPLVVGIAKKLVEDGMTDNQNVLTIHWIGEHIEKLENFLTFLQGTNIPYTPLQGMNPTHFFVVMKELASMAEVQSQVYTFSLNHHEYSFDSNIWTQLVGTHNIEKALQEYTALNTDFDGAIFFSHTPKPPTQTLIYSPGVISFYNTHINVPERFSRLEYERQVRAAVEKLTSYIENLKINPEEKKRFTNFLIKESMHYIKKYQEKYLAIFDAYQVQISSPSDLPKLFAELTKPNAVFYEFLKSIQHHTSTLSEPLMTLTHLKEVNPFNFLEYTLTAKDGKSPIEDYQRLMGEILKELQEDTPSEEVSFASLQLSRIEKMSINIFHNNLFSTLRKVEDCVAQMQVPERFKAPFLQPVRLLYQIGLRELKETIEHHWKSYTYPQLATLFDKFPFNPEAANVATVGEINLLLNPKSEFYTNLEKMMSIVCCQKEGRLVPIDANAVALNEGIYQQLNRASKIAHTFWDAEGNPKPLTLKIATIPFIQPTQSSTAILKSCIVEGDQSIYNINQDPTWQTLNISWWKENLSLIGTTVVHKDSGKKSYLTVEPSSSVWSFFSLLKKGSRKDGHVWEWNLPTQEDQTLHTISFKFDANPQEQLGF